MADIDQIIAGGAGASSRGDFSGIGDIAESYWKGKDRRYTQEGRDLFKGGVPKNADGSIDYGAMRNALFTHGDVGQGVQLENVDLARQQLKLGQAAVDVANRYETGGQSPPILPPSANRTASTPVAPPLNRGGIDSQAQGAPAGPPAGAPAGGRRATLLQVLDAQGIPNDQLGAASASIGRQLGVDPSQPLDLDDPQVRNVLAPAVAQLKRTGVGNIIPPGQPVPDQVLQPGPQVAGPRGPAQPNAQGGPAPQPPPQAPVAPPQSAPPPVAAGQPGPVTNAATGTTAPSIPSRIDQGIALYSSMAMNPGLPPATREAAKARLQFLEKQNETTPEQKNYIQAKLQGFPGTMDDFAAHSEAKKATAKATAEANVKEQEGIIDSGRAAGQRLTTLNTVANIIQGDKNMTLGFGAETALKVKKALQQIGLDVGDLSGAQSIEKLNGMLAAESAKTVSPRPAQFEFKTFLNNNPGLNLDRAGNLRVISIFSQLAKRDLDLGKLARQSRGNWDAWDNVVESYDKKNPIVDPVTKTPVSTNTVIAPDPAKSAPPAGQPAFSKGQTAINPKTKERMQFDGTAWVPFT